LSLFITKGMFYSRGEYILMVDADGATLFSDIEKVEKKMKEKEKEGLGLVIGSRAHLKESNVERKFHRRILAWGFHQVVKFVGVQGIEDTQVFLKRKI
jgi:dolichyl-phosphate beta-glucosyltransferase